MRTKIRAGWPVASKKYGATVLFAGLLLTAGALGDRFGRKPALIGGLLVFALSALMGGLANGAEQLIASRALMGVGAAFIMPAPRPRPVAPPATAGARRATTT